MIEKVFLTRRQITLLLALLVFVIQACFVNELGWNQKARIAATFAFVEPNTPDTGTFRINRFYRNPTRGLKTKDWARSGTQYYPNKAPGSFMLGVPAYYAIFNAERMLGVDPTSEKVLKENSWLLNLWVSVFFNAVAAVYLFKGLIAIGQVPRDALINALLYSFGTLILPFSGSIWGNTTAAAFLVLSVYSWINFTLPEACSPSTNRRAWFAGGCGFFATAALLTEYLAGAPLVLIGCTFLLKKERWPFIPYFALGAALPLGLLLWYHHSNFGNFLTTAAALSNPIFLQEHKLGGQFGVFSFEIMIKLLFSLYRGVIPFMPILIMCVIGAWRLIRGPHRELAWLCLAVFVSVIFAISSFNAWAGGYSTGPRYFIVVLPFVAFLLPSFSQLNRPLAAAYAVAALLSFFNMWLIAGNTVLLPDHIENPLYGDTYLRFWNGEF